MAQHSVRASVRKKLAREAGRRCMQNQAHNRARGLEPDEFDALVNRMRNRERHAWACAGYPGLRKREVAALRDFLSRECAESVNRILTAALARAEVR